MKTNKYTKLTMVAFMAGASMLWSSCTDEWDDHYKASDAAMASQESLWQNISSDASLANFSKVVSAIGCGDLLNSPQQLTVWAPTSLTDAQADSIIQVYQNDAAMGLKQNDNKAITQFLQNHVALYSRPVSSLTNDTISMLNKKYMHLVGTSNTSGTLNKTSFSDAVICNNGILYKTNAKMDFFPNIREYMEQSSIMDSIVKLYTSKDIYELDEKSSVPGGVVDGQTVYLDSVTYLNNILFSAYGYIQREDSTYTIVAPTDEVWARDYEKYHKYFNYDASLDKSVADSLSDINTKLRILEGRIFNTSMDWHLNLHPEDSLCNTQYKTLQKHNPRLNVYYHPYSGILSGLQKVQCSNGTVYIDDKGVITPQSTFFGRNDIEATYNFEIPKNSSNEETMSVALMTKNYYSDSVTISKSYNYAMVTAKMSSAQTELEYRLPETLSGCYYNIYLVTIPGDNGLDSWMNVQYSTKNEKGEFTTFKPYDNPYPITESSEVANADIIAKQSNSQRIFVGSGERVDTILVQSAVKWDYAGYSLDDGVVKIKISSVGPTSSREKKYTRTLRLNEFILVPFETEEEALAAKDDKDAFNDEKLEANKEK